MNHIIFISYAHEDKEKVYSFINQLNSSGYRVWYDGGIHSGEAWADILADKITGCGVFVSIVTRNFLESVNCNKELKYASMENVDRFIIYLEDVKLSPGQELYNCDIQNIYASDLEVDELVSRLHDNQLLETCRSKLASPIAVQRTLVDRNLLTDNNVIMKQRLDIKKKEKSIEKSVDGSIYEEVIREVFGDDLDSYYPEHED